MAVTMLRRKEQTAADDGQGVFEKPVHGVVCLLRWKNCKKSNVNVLFRKWKVKGIIEIDKVKS
ncbi:MAG: hypothetical protein IKP58_07975 [Victivallales bacterium]|nr:hypothetical protein [Victivallales bacterium]